MRFHDERAETHARQSRVTLSNGNRRRPMIIVPPIIAPGVVSPRITRYAPIASTQICMPKRAERVTEYMPLLRTFPISSNSLAWTCDWRQRMASAGNMPIASIASAFDTVDPISPILRRLASVPSLVICRTSKSPNRLSPMRTSTATSPAIP